MPRMYALYAWGNFISEVGLDRRPAWLDPAVLRGEQQVIDESLMIGDTDTLLVDGPGTLFEIDGDDENLVPGSELIGRDLSGVEWRVSRIRAATDGTREDALRIVAVIEEDGDYYEEDERHEYNSVPVGEVVTLWEDGHGQWTLALVEL
ncbi:hypothetical protein TPA0908_41030 [Micromonospora sp. AKA38]|nr:hypothetical protein TPA0908_41030 [Micromonospora sp. AKA38]